MFKYALYRKCHPKRKPDWYFRFNGTSIEARIECAKLDREHFPHHPLGGFHDYMEVEAFEKWMEMDINSHC